MFGKLRIIPQTGPLLFLLLVDRERRANPGQRIRRQATLSFTHSKAANATARLPFPYLDSRYTK
jgi:hypothetical protein